MPHRPSSKSCSCHPDGRLWSGQPFTLTGRCHSKLPLCYDTKGDFKHVVAMTLFQRKKCITSIIYEVYVELSMLLSDGSL